jgi:hypothetical protein
MKESAKSVTGGVGVSTGRPMRSSSASKVNEFSPGTIISSDSISFEVLYVGKLRMSYRKAPTSFIDEALDKFKSHENEKMIVERRDSVLESRRSSSQSQVFIKVQLCILNNKIGSDYNASFPIHPA